MNDEKVIQDAQEAAGNRMYLKALDDCIEIVKKSRVGWLAIDTLEEMKAQFLSDLSETKAPTDKGG